MYASLWSSSDTCPFPRVVSYYLICLVNPVLLMKIIVKSTIYCRKRIPKAGKHKRWLWLDWHVVIVMLLVILSHLYSWLLFSNHLYVCIPVIQKHKMDGIGYEGHLTDGTTCSLSRGRTSKASLHTVSYPWNLTVQRGEVGITLRRTSLELLRRVRRITTIQSFYSQPASQKGWIRSMATV